jgi:hypothetical protein
LITRRQAFLYLVQLVGEVRECAVQSGALERPSGGRLRTTPEKLEHSLQLT